MAAVGCCRYDGDAYAVVEPVLEKIGASGETGMELI
jgi:hypothetical protein